VAGVGVAGGDQDAGEDPSGAAERGEDQRLGGELDCDVAAGGAERAP
jgi:hypothetical protein